jgi:hypothetical protein
MRRRQPDGSAVWVRAEHLGQSVTRVELDPHAVDADHAKLALSTDNDRALSLIAKALKPKDQAYAIAVQHVEEVVERHAGGAKPGWVKSDDRVLQRILAEFYDCPQGEPKALYNNGGRDELCAVLTTSYMALSAATTPALAATDTTFSGEITTSGGGLIRGSATYAHTAGTNAVTLTKTFTANGSDSLPVTASREAVFSASSGGTLRQESALSSSVTLNATGDNVTVTATIDIG